jgi:ATP-binding cassette subfamily C protein
MESAECGAAALAIILGYYGKYVPLEELRLRCGVSRDGSKAINIIKAAKLYQLEARGCKADLDELRQLDLPCIVFWGFNHYLVVEGFSKSKVYLNDPASGPRATSYEDFEAKYTGVVLCFTPQEVFTKTPRPNKIWVNLKERTKSVRGPLLYISLCGFGLIFPGWVAPALSQLFFDNVLTQYFLYWGTGIAWTLFGLSLLAGGLTWFQVAFLNRLNACLSVRFASDFLQHILQLPMSFYAQRFSGEIAYRTTLNETVSQTLTGSLASTGVSVVLIVFYAFFMLAYDVVIAMIGIVSAVINLLVLWLINRSRQDAHARRQQEMGKSVGFAIGALQNIEICKAAGTEIDVFSRWTGYYAKKLDAEREINTKDAVLTVVPVLLNSLSLAALLGIGVWRIMHAELTVGMLMALQGLLFNFLAPVNQMVFFGSSLQLMKIDIDRLDDILKNKTDPALHTVSMKEGDRIKLEGYLELKEVSFSYSPIDPPLIENLSLRLKPGERVAFVGPTGCGKSTVANLLSGLYQVSSGTILYDGKKRDEIPHSVLTNSISVVDQKIYLFAGSIKENLTLWDKTILDEDLVTAAEDACIHKEIVERQGGYQSFLTEGGTNLSGGERQKLEIARALVLSPSILIMDEATSALDSKTEKQISDNVRRRGCSCVMIAHRLSTIRDCDEIIVMDRGKIIQRGNHESLKNEPGVYKDLVDREQLS